MTLTGAFPNSPLSRSALRADTDVEGDGPVSKPPPLSPRHPTSPLRQAQTFATPRNVSGPSAFPARHGPYWSPDLSATPSSPPAPSSSLSRSAARRRLSGQSFIGHSPTPNFGSLIGSYEESLLRGRMSMPASKPLTFDAELGVLGLGKCRPSLKCPSHVNLKFPAHFYDLKAAATGFSERDASSAMGSPYVGTLDLEGHYYDKLQSQPGPTTGPAVDGSNKGVPAFPGYQIPAKGQVQLIIKNPNLTAVKLFLVPYDLTDMPAGAKTFIRQKSMVATPVAGSEAASSYRHPNGSPSSVRSGPPHAQTTNKEMLRYAIHLQFCSPPAPVVKQRQKSEPGFDGPLTFAKQGQSIVDAPAPQPKIYLHKTIRVVFAARAPDKSEKLNVVTESPGDGEQRFATFAGAGDEWKKAVRAAKARKPDTSSDAIAEVRSDRDQVLGLGLGLSELSEQATTEPIYVSVPGTPAAPYEPNSDPDGERWVEPAEGRAGARLATTPAFSLGTAWSSDSSKSSYDTSLSSQSRVSSAFSSRAPNEPPIVDVAGGGRSRRGTASSSHSQFRPMSPTSTASSENDRALLDAWHQTWRRQPSVHSFRPASPGSGRATPTASRPLSPSFNLAVRSASPTAALTTSAQAVEDKTATAHKLSEQFAVQASLTTPDQDRGDPPREAFR